MNFISTLKAGVVTVHSEGSDILRVFVAGGIAEALVERMRQNQYGRDAQIIGEVKEEPRGIVAMVTAFGGTRIVDMLAGEQLPRIC